MTTVARLGLALGVCWSQQRLPLAHGSKAPQLGRGAFRTFTGMPVAAAAQAEDAEGRGKENETDNPAPAPAPVRARQATAAFCGGAGRVRAQRQAATTVVQSKELTKQAAGKASAQLEEAWVEQALKQKNKSAVAARRRRSIKLDSEKVAPEEELREKFPLVAAACDSLARETNVRDTEVCVAVAKDGADFDCNRRTDKLRDVLKQLEGMEAWRAKEGHPQPWLGLEELAARWLWDMELTAPEAAMIDRVSSVDQSEVQARWGGVGEFIVSTDGQWSNFVVKSFGDSTNMLEAFLKEQTEAVNKAEKWEVWRTREGPQYGPLKARGVQVGQMLLKVRDDVAALDTHLPGLGSACVEHVLQQRRAQTARVFSADLGAAEAMAARLAKAVKKRPDALDALRRWRDSVHGACFDRSRVLQAASILLESDSDSAAGKRIEFLQNIDALNADVPELGDRLREKVEVAGKVNGPGREQFFAVLLEIKCFRSSGRTALKQAAKLKMGARLADALLGAEWQKREETTIQLVAQALQERGWVGSLAVAKLNKLVYGLPLREGALGALGDEIRELLVRDVEREKNFTAVKADARLHSILNDMGRLTEAGLSEVNKAGEKVGRSRFVPALAALLWNMEGPREEAALNFADISQGHGGIRRAPWAQLVSTRRVLGSPFLMRARRFVNGGRFLAAGERPGDEAWEKVYAAARAEAAAKADVLAAVSEA